MRVRNTLLLASALGGGLALPAAGQTGRIALASHAGRVDMLVEASDNLGLPEHSFWKADTLVYVNDSTVMHKGLYARGFGRPADKTEWQRRVEVDEEFRYEYKNWPSNSILKKVEYMRLKYPEAVFMGFDRLQKSAPNKPANRTQTFPRRPFQYSYWRGLATVAALGAVGWLLGRKSKTV